MAAGDSSLQETVIVATAEVRSATVSVAKAQAFQTMLNALIAAVQGRSAIALTVMEPV
jgi:hypothetical protein